MIIRRCFSPGSGVPRWTSSSNEAASPPFVEAFSALIAPFDGAARSVIADRNTQSRFSCFVSRAKNFRVGGQISSVDYAGDNSETAPLMFEKAFILLLPKHREPGPKHSIVRYVHEKEMIKCRHFSLPFPSWRGPGHLRMYCRSVCVYCTIGVEDSIYWLGRPAGKPSCLYWGPNLEPRTRTRVHTLGLVISEVSKFNFTSRIQL